MLLCYNLSMEIDKFLDFKGRSVLITGAASGIGKEAALLFSQLGASVVLIDFDQSGLDLATKLCGEGSRGYRLDLSKKQEIDKFWSNLDAVPDIIINNAGVYPFIKFEELDEKTLDKVLNVNLNSMFWMCQEFIKRKKKRGIIINVSSIEAILPFKRNMSHYTAPKAGVIALTRGLAHDYARKGFRANVILPGAIKTPTTRKLIGKAIKTVSFELMKVGYDFGTRLPEGRWGRPEEVAKAMVFLASDLSSYINGAVLPVDGGFLSS